MKMQIKRQKAKGKRQKWDSDGCAGFIKKKVPTFCLLPFAFCLLISCAAFCLLPSFAFAQTVAWSPDKLINGAPVVFRYQSPTPIKSLDGNFLGKRVFFRFDAGSNAWYGFAGIDYDTKAGNHDLNMTATATSGQKSSFAQVVPVAKGYYRTSTISVPKKYVDPDPADVARIVAERDLKSDLLNRVTNTQLWTGSFAAPASLGTTSEFGSQRTYNGKRQSVHFGLDYAAGIGTPIRAINSGKVIIARDLYFEGNCVVIDHGQGLLSLYFHLSQFKIKEGDTVSKGQLIALSGGTGRVTGPHLHLAVRWQGSYVNPATLIGLRLP
jgi:hypothetical protein